jgi:hypothetical protein
MRKCVIAVVFWSFLNHAAQAAIIDEAELSGVRYYLIAASSWHDSESEAQAMGGHLAVINSMAEHNFIYNRFGPAALASAPASGKVNLWLGFSDRNMDGNLETCDGSQAVFTNFFPEQPQRNFTDEMFMGIRVRGLNDDFPVGKWIDIVSNTRLGDLSFGIVEITPVPEPAAWLLVFCGLGGGIALRDRLSKSWFRGGN